MEGRSAVTAATGALGPVIAKLNALLGDEYKLLEGSRSDIELIKSQLEPVHSLLSRKRDSHPTTLRNGTYARTYLHSEVNEREQMVDVREASYDMDDSIGDFMLGLERNGEGFMQRIEMSPFQDLKVQVRGLINRCPDEWMTPETISTNRSKPTDPKARFLHENEWDLMETGEKEDELINLLIGDKEGASTQHLKTVCILGFAGMGKTTLAHRVYQKMGEVRDNISKNTIEQKFKYRAFVSVSPSSNMIEILRTIFTQVNKGGDEAATEQHLISDISNFLGDKRYLVIVDDIWHWDDWEIIRKAIPKNNLGSRIITTTRINAIAEKFRCEEDAFIYNISGIGVDAAMLSVAIVRRSVAGMKNGFDEDKPCHDIVQMCRGMPLALVCMSSALAEKLLVQDDHEEWASWWSVNYVLDGFLSIPSLKPLVESLCLGYNDLPIHLRTCLLYCSIYPDGHKIERHHLVRKWIAEGFVYQEEEAESYFDELVSRNLLHPAKEGKYEVHPVMLAFLVCKSKEANFVTCGPSYGRQHMHGGPKYDTRIHRLSLGYRNNVEFSTMDVSHTRSLVVFGVARKVVFRKLEGLRVLDLEYSRGLKNADLVDICGLLFLRYMGLKGCCQITELPREMRRLQNLEILDVRNTGVRVLPMEVGQLPKLVRVFAGKGVKLPKGLLVAAVTNNKGVRSSQASRSAERSMVTCDKFGLITEPLLERLSVTGRNVHVPQSVKKNFSYPYSLDIRLCKLEEDDLKILQEIPNLLVLTLRFEVLPRFPISISGGGFPRLQGFRFDCRLPRVTFQPGAMPKLKYVEFKFYAGPASQHPLGVTQLQSLERVIFRCSPWYRSDDPGISAAIAIVRKEAEEHCNWISLSINGNEEVFPAKNTEDICDQDSIDVAGSSSENLIGTSPAGHATNSASCRGTSEIEEAEG